MQSRKQYRTKMSEIADALADLNMLLEEHWHNRREDANYADIGDLGHVLMLLDEAVAYLSQEEDA